MIDVVKDTLWQQFGASIDMLKNAIGYWPDDRWATKRIFFYNAYHCLVFLDYYLTIPYPNDFSSPLPFTLKGPDDLPPEAIDDVIPDRIYSKEELLGYLQTCREKCRGVIANLTEEKLSERWIENEGGKNFAVMELLFYNMRHVQHHAAQLNMLLRQEINDTPGWLRRSQP